MKFAKIIILAMFLVSLSLITIACTNAIDEEITVSESDNKTVTTVATVATTEELTYVNEQFGFDFKLPKSWDGYLVLEETWTGSTSELDISGPKIILRHPNWTDSKPMQDIPILIFTPQQWQDILAEKYNVSAAPIPPSLLGENDTYVFALPPRYNFAYLDGFEDVEAILKEAPLSTFELRK